MASQERTIASFFSNNRKSPSPVKSKKVRKLNIFHSEESKITVIPKNSLKNATNTVESDIAKAINGTSVQVNNDSRKKKSKTLKLNDKLHETKKMIDDCSSRIEYIKALKKAREEKPKIRISPKQAKKKRNGKCPSKIPDVIKSLPQVEIDEEEHNTNAINPVLESKTLFQWLIHPHSIDDFFKENWEKAPLHIKRTKRSYYKLLMSTPLIDDILRRYSVLYTKNLDITSYSNGIRETHNPQGRAHPSVVWDYYSNGCSIRMLNPQTFIPKIHTINATLQEYFGCFVGANFYLTPPGSQGFAPHYDDIEAFILQIEGKKRWRLYKPRNNTEYLTRVSSKNFQQSEIGEPILDIVLNAGDLLYFPRGTIHQGETHEDSHSLHVTLSVYQKNCWGDFIEQLLPAALTTAICKNSQLREGLPLDYLNNIGLSYADKDNEFRRKFIETTKELLHKVIDKIDVDAAADQMAKRHIYDALPPVLAPVEMECSVLRDGEKITEDGKIENRVEIEPDTRIRLTRAHCARLIEEENTYRLYYSTENSREYHEYEAQYLEVDKEIAPAMKRIIEVYPEFIRVDDLPIQGEDSRVCK